MVVAAVAFAAAFSQAAQITSNPPSPSGTVAHQIDKPKAQPTNDAAKTDERGTDKIPITVKVLAAPDAKAKADAEKEEEQRKAANDDALRLYALLTTIFTGALMCAAFVQAGLFIWQLLLIADSAKDTAELARAARDNAAAAKQQAEETRLLQRAYISIEPQGIRNFSKSPTAAIAHIQIKNVGHLPAKNVRWDLKVTPSKANDLDDFDVNLLSPKGADVIFPGMEVRRGSEPTETAPTERQKGFFYVWGIVCYNDGFDPDRWTKFCLRYNREAEKRPENGGFVLDSQDARYHEHGNDAS